MGLRGTCDCICYHPPTCEHGWLDIGLNGYLNNLFQIVENLDWQNEEELSPPSTLTLTWYAAGVTYDGGFSSKIWWPILGVPFDFCTLTYDPDTRTYTGTCNASPADDLGLSNTVEITICGYDGFHSEYDRHWMMKGSIIAADGTTRQTIGQLIPGRRPASIHVTGSGYVWCDSCMVTSSNYINGNDDDFKDAKKLLFHRFLWMLPELTAVDISGIGCGPAETYNVPAVFNSGYWQAWRNGDRIWAGVVSFPDAQGVIYYRPNLLTTTYIYWAEFTPGVIDLWGTNVIPYYQKGGIPDPDSICTIPGTATWSFVQWDN